jgi:hypothetical protein
MTYRTKTHNYLSMLTRQAYRARVWRDCIQPVSLILANLRAAA